MGRKVGTVLRDSSGPWIRLLILGPVLVVISPLIWVLKKLRNLVRDYFDFDTF